MAKPPFDIRTSDIVLRTSDNVDFYLAKVILSIASTFFETMFSLTQPADNASSIVTDPILISEDSETFDCLMRLIYPVDDPIITNLDLMDKVLEAAVKYDVGQAIRLACAAMRKGFAQSSPLDVYAIACRLHIEAEAKHAAGEWKQNMHRSWGEVGDFKHTVAEASFVPRMAQISAGAYFRLIAYLRGTETQPQFVDGIGSDPTRPTALLTQPATSPPPTLGQAKHSIPLYDTTDADIILLSSDSARFPVHSLVLRLSGAGMLLKGTPLQPSELVHSKGSSVSSSPIISTELESQTLSLLLSMCYPLTQFDIVDFSSWLTVYHAAHRLEISPVVAALRSRFKSHIMNCPSPMSMYCFAVETGWMEEAQDVAGVIAQQQKQYTYASEMDKSSFSALAYHHLLKFCHAYDEAIFEVCLEHDVKDSSFRTEEYQGVPLSLTSISTLIVERCLRLDTNHSRYCRDTFDPPEWLEASKLFENDMKNALTRVCDEPFPSRRKFWAALTSILHLEIQLDIGPTSAD